MHMILNCKFFRIQRDNMNYFELQALSNMTSYNSSFKESVIKVIEQLEDEVKVF